MSSFPSAIKTFRTVADRIGVVYDALKTKVFYAKDFNDLADEVVAIETILGLNPEGIFTTVVDRLDFYDYLLPVGDTVGTTDEQTLTNKTLTAPVWDCWSNLIDEGTRVSAFVMTVTGDFTGSIQKGEKIKLTDTTTKYFNVESISYGGGVSTITFITNDDYSLVANPEDIFYSKVESPQGFPAQFTFSTVHGGYSTAPTGKLKFKVFGNRFVCDYADYSGGISNSTATNFTVPVAALTNISNLHPIHYKNNGTNSATIGNLQCYASSKTISAWTTFYHGTWVAANGKDVYFSNLSFNF